MPTYNKRVVEHTFVVPAYGDSPWLERCVQSLLCQSVRSTVLIATSTPNDEIRRVSAANRVQMVVNPVSAGIASDWNFALQLAQSDWVTLAHQDDFYAPTYTERCLAAAAARADVTLVFCAAREILAESERSSANGVIKHSVRAAVFFGARGIASGLRKRLLVRFGNPVPCPAVMIHRRNLEEFRFQSGWKSNLDWLAWIELAERPGAFVYVNEPLVVRTIHAESATIRDFSDRAREDEAILKRLWPTPVAEVLTALYAAGRWQYRLFSTARTKDS